MISGIIFRITIKWNTLAIYVKLIRMKNEDIFLGIFSFEVFINSFIGPDFRNVEIKISKSF